MIPNSLLALPSDVWHEIGPFLCLDSSLNLLKSSKDLMTEHMHVLTTDRDPNALMSQLFERTGGSFIGTGFLKNPQLRDSVTQINLCCFPELTRNKIQKIVSSFKNLQELTLSSNNQLSDLRIPELTQLTSLRKLDLALCKVTNTSIAFFPKSLRVLNLTGNPITNNALQALSSFQLEELTLSSCNEITNLAPLAQMHTLQRLSLNSCTRLTNVSLRVLEGHPSLKSLQLRGLLLTESTVHILVKIPLLEEVVSYSQDALSETAKDRLTSHLKKNKQ